LTEKPVVEVGWRETKVGGSKDIPTTVEKRARIRIRLNKYRDRSLGDLMIARESVKGIQTAGARQSSLGRRKNTRGYLLSTYET